MWDGLHRLEAYALMLKPERGRGTAGCNGSGSRESSLIHVNDGAPAG